MDTNTNIFEQASRLKIRFHSERGELSVENLWDMPLTSKNGFDLDTLARTINSAVKDLTEESFVPTKKANPQVAYLTLSLDIVKHIIAVKVAEKEAADAKSLRRQERTQLLALLDKKENEAREGMTADQIKARLAELDD